MELKPKEELLRIIDENIETKKELVRFSLNVLRELRWEIRRDRFRDYPPVVMFALHAYRDKCREDLTLRIENLRSALHERGELL